jgi:hypothetical protein
VFAAIAHNNTTKEIFMRNMLTSLLLLLILTACSDEPKELVTQVNTPTPIVVIGYQPEPLPYTYQELEVEYLQCMSVTNFDDDECEERCEDETNMSPLCDRIEDDWSLIIGKKSDSHSRSAFKTIRITNETNWRDRGRSYNCKANTCQQKQVRTINYSNGQSSSQERTIKVNATSSNAQQVATAAVVVGSTSLNTPVRKSSVYSKKSTTSTPAKITPNSAVPVRKPSIYSKKQNNANATPDTLKKQAVTPPVPPVRKASVYSKKQTNNTVNDAVQKKRSVYSKANHSAKDAKIAKEKAEAKIKAKAKEKARQGKLKAELKRKQAARKKAAEKKARARKNR